MKLRNFTLTLFLSILLLNIYAQKGGMISFGATPGLSYMLKQNTYFLANNSKELNYKPKFSYHVFLQGGYNFAEQHGIVAFVNFCDEGQKYKDEFKYKIYPALIGTHYKNVDFKYMGFGVLYRFAPLLPGQKSHVRTSEFHWRMKLMVGFEADFLLNAQMSYKVDLNNTGNMINYGYPIPYAIPGYSTPTPPGGEPGYGYKGYEPNPSNNYKSYFQTIQGVGVLRYGFDYVFNNHMYIGLALEGKFGLNDINAKAFRVHPDYHKSKNYFFGLNVEVGYIFQKATGDKTLKKEKKKVEKPKEVKTKTPGIDVNHQVDKVDKGTVKRLKKGK